jgi:hypothetical protein
MLLFLLCRQRRDSYYLRGLPAELCPFDIAHILACLKAVFAGHVDVEQDCLISIRANAALALFKGSRRHTDHRS